MLCGHCAVAPFGTCLPIRFYNALDYRKYDLVSPTRSMWHILSVKSKTICHTFGASGQGFWVSLRHYNSRLNPKRILYDFSSVGWQFAARFDGDVLSGEVLQRRVGSCCSAVEVTCWCDWSGWVRPKWYVGCENVYCKMKQDLWRQQFCIEFHDSSNFDYPKKP